MTEINESALRRAALYEGEPMDEVAPDDASPHVEAAREKIIEARGALSGAMEAISKPRGMVEYSAATRLLAEAEVASHCAAVRVAMLEIEETMPVEVGAR